jgi:hypothetical protein
LGAVLNLSRFQAHTTKEAFVIAGMKDEWVQFLEAKEDDNTLMFLKEYYVGDSRNGLSNLLTALNDPLILKNHVEALAAICIQDLGFTDSDELESFLTANLNARERVNLNRRLEFLFEHYRRDPNDIRALEQAAASSFDWVTSAVCWANSGDLDACRASLAKAESLMENDFFAWEYFCPKYLHLLGDFEKYYNVLDSQVKTCVNSYCFLIIAENLVSYVGKEGESKAMELMHYAELAADDPHDLLSIADSWEKDFNNPDRASKCRNVAALNMDVENHRND